MSRVAQFHKEKPIMNTQRGICRIAGAPKIGVGDGDIGPMDILVLHGLL